jgi:hypothetical protein
MSGAVARPVAMAVGSTSGRRTPPVSGQRAGDSPVQLLPLASGYRRTAEGTGR